MSVAASFRGMRSFFCASRAAIHAGNAKVSLCSIWKSLLSEKRPKQNQKTPKNRATTTKRTRDRSLLKIHLNVHAWVRQKVKQMLGNELEQNGHEIGYLRCGTKCLLARHDSGQKASISISRLCHRALMSCILRTHSWNGNRRRHLKGHGQTSRKSWQLSNPKALAPQLHGILEPASKPTQTSNCLRRCRCYPGSSGGVSARAPTTESDFDKECYTRANVALSRATDLTVLACPLNMHGLEGAAQVIAALLHGVCTLRTSNTVPGTAQVEGSFDIGN